MEVVYKLWRLFLSVLSYVTTFKLFLVVVPFLVQSLWVPNKHENPQLVIILIALQWVNIKAKNTPSASLEVNKQLNLFICFIIQVVGDYLNSSSFHRMRKKEKYLHHCPPAPNPNTHMEWKVLMNSMARTKAGRNILF